MAALMRCDICGKPGVHVRTVTRSFGSGRSAFLVEDVPLVACRACGESYFTAETLREIERIRAHWRRLTTPKRVLVAKFGGTA